MITEIIETSLGKIKCERLGEILAFRGIRYATASRFELPVMTSFLGEEYDATFFKDACIQDSTFGLQRDGLYKKEFPSDNLTYSEDCLNLNIYAPKNAKNCPVIIMIHGGSFSTGASSKIQMNSLEYPKRDVIYVSINYRLNIFGFFAKSGITKNLGLQDQLCAIKFIYKYIEEFGGDKNNITLQGQSAGAMCITSLANSGCIDNYIKRLILRSGGGNFPVLFVPRNIKKIEKFYDKTYSKFTNEQLKNMPAEELFKLWKSKDSSMSFYNCFPVDDGIVSSSKLKFNFETIIGTVKLDMTNKLLKSTANKYAKNCKKAGVNCYVYEFNRPLPGGEIHHFHSADEWFFLGSIDKCWRDFNKEDYQLETEIVERISNFAKGESPNYGGYKEWKVFSSRKDILKF